ncbi:MAG: hypothetical protein Salg2KO_20320 [Salibacteraceae bacterium]
MTTIDMKSLLIGAGLMAGTFALLSGTPDNGSEIEFVPSATGTAIYNKQTRTLYVYKMWNLKLNTAPTQTLIVSEDGSSMENF